MINDYFLCYFGQFDCYFEKKSKNSKNVKKSIDING